MRAHLARVSDGIVDVGPVLERVDDFAAFLEAPEDEPATAALRRSRTTGRPAGSEDFTASLEDRLGRPLAPAKRGPKPRQAPESEIGDLFREPSP